MRYFIVDAFADSLFSGNPAGVCLLENELSETVMQSIATENNLSETAFVQKRDGYYTLRWFTPKVEVDLCGHATLASAFVVASFVDPITDEFRFETKRSGTLTVKKAGSLFEMDFPSGKPQKTEVLPQMEAAIGTVVLESYTSMGDLMLLIEDEDRVRTLTPDFKALEPLAPRGVIVTAKGNSVDFVSRFFGPNVGVPEDPVTGSAHTALIPFWAEKLGTKQMTASQLSKRGGTLYCLDSEDRVKIAGNAVLYLKGEIFV